MTKREQAMAIINKLDDIGREECSYEYGLPIYNELIVDKMVNAVLDIIDPRQSEAAEATK